MTTNFGNIDVTLNRKSVALRMRHVVEGHPGCWLTADEADGLAQHLAKCAADIRTSPALKRLSDVDDLL